MIEYWFWMSVRYLALFASGYAAGELWRRWRGGRAGG